MAQWLKINGGSLASAIDLALGTAGAGTHLSTDPPGYSPMDPTPEISYNASLYTDGNRPVHSRSGNIIETIVVDIRGSSIDDAFAKLRALKKALWEARDYFQSPGLRSPLYLEYKPHGSTNTAYSAIINATVMEPATLLDTPLIAARINGVVITLEREPFWRERPPVRSATVTDYATQVLGATAITAQWGKLTVSGGNAIPGDLEALCRLYIERNDTTSNAVHEVIAGYRSVLRGGANAGNGGLIEIESGTAGTDTSVTTDATASPGSGNTKMQCTFATLPGQATRWGKSITSAPPGNWRVFLRARMSAGSSSSSVFLYYMGSADAVSSFRYNASVLVDDVDWKLYDLGIIPIPTTSGLPSQLATTASIALGLIADRQSGAASLDMDFLFLVPVDESYLTLSDGTLVYSAAHSSYEYNNILPLQETAENMRSGAQLELLAWAGDLHLPPGDGYLYVVTGHVIGNNGWFNNLTGYGVNVTLHRCALYQSARGAG